MWSFGGHFRRALTGDNKAETLYAVAESGKATVKVSSLSPFGEYVSGDTPTQQTQSSASGSQTQSQSGNTTASTVTASTGTTRTEVNVTTGKSPSTGETGGRSYGSAGFLLMLSVCVIAMVIHYLSRERLLRDICRRRD